MAYRSKFDTYPLEIKWTAAVIAFIIVCDINNDSSNEAKNEFIKALKDEFGISIKWIWLWPKIRNHRGLIEKKKEGTPTKRGILHIGTTQGRQLSKNE